MLKLHYLYPLLGGHIRTFTYKQERRSAMVWPFGKRRRKIQPPQPESSTANTASTIPREEPDEYEQLATALLKRAYEASIGRPLNEEFNVLMTDAEEDRARKLPDTRAVFEITCNEAHRYGLQVESAYNFAYTFSRL